MRYHRRPFRRVLASKKCVTLHKRCSASPDAIWHSADVDQAVVSQFEALRPAIKREWCSLLRAEPALSPLGLPETLAYMMDETLTQVLKGAGSHSLKTWLRRSPALLAPLQKHCRCGLNPLLNYFATGELALHSAIGNRLAPEARDVLLTVFHVKAQQEIETLCAVCVQHPSGHCRKEPSLSARSGH